MLNVCDAPDTVNTATYPMAFLSAFLSISKGVCLRMSLARLRLCLRPDPPVGGWGVGGGGGSSNNSGLPPTLHLAAPVALGFFFFFCI